MNGELCRLVEHIRMGLRHHSGRCMSIRKTSQITPIFQSGRKLCNIEIPRRRRVMLSLLLLLLCVCIIVTKKKRGGGWIIEQLFHGGVMPNDHYCIHIWEDVALLSLSLSYHHHHYCCLAYLPNDSTIPHRINRTMISIESYTTTTQLFIIVVVSSSPFDWLILFLTVQNLPRRWLDYCNDDYYYCYCYHYPTSILPKPKEYSKYLRSLLLLFLRHVFVAVSSLSSYCGVFYTRNVPSVFLSMIMVDRNH